jgi:hypothetical protein
VFRGLARVIEILKNCIKLAGFPERAVDVLVFEYFLENGAGGQRRKETVPR